MSTQPTCLRSPPIFSPTQVLEFHQEPNFQKLGSNNMGLAIQDSLPTCIMSKETTTQMALQFLWGMPPLGKTEQGATRKAQLSVDPPTRPYICRSKSACKRSGKSTTTMAKLAQMRIALLQILKFKIRGKTSRCLSL